MLVLVANILDIVMGHTAWSMLTPWKPSTTGDTFATEARGYHHVRSPEISLY